MTKPTYTVRRVRNLQVWLPTLQAVDRVCFPCDDPHVFDGSEVWVLLDVCGNAAGFTSSKLVAPKTAFLNRYGVLPAYRGQGLQKKLLQAQLKHYRRAGVKRVITYTVLTNPKSSNTLIGLGFRLYRPRFKWAAVNVTYLIRRL